MVLFWETFHAVPVQKLNGSLSINFTGMRCTYISVHRSDVTSQNSTVVVLMAVNAVSQKEVHKLLPVW